MPIESFSFRGMTLRKRQVRIDDEDVRYLEVRAEGEDVFGPHSLAFRVELPESGVYAVSLEALGGPDRAAVRMFRNDRPQGAEVDLYRPGTSASARCASASCRSSRARTSCS